MNIRMDAMKNLRFGMAAAATCLCIVAGGTLAWASSSELITRAWGEQKTDPAASLDTARQCIELYQDSADEQQASLKALPKDKDAIEKVQALNDVATAYFIQGEIYREQGRQEAAIAAFKTVVERYCFAQAWDPRGWFWQISKTAKESILKLDPEAKIVSPCLETDEKKAPPAPEPSQIVSGIELYDPGREEIVNYSRYGEFKGVGTDQYQYVIRDQEGLSAAVGEGIFPNTTSVRWDPLFKQFREAKRLDVKNLPPEEASKGHWFYLQSPDLQAAFFKWVTASESAGVKLFYTGMLLEKAGLIKHAVKCYYAIVVHYPAAYGWTYFKTPWYVGPAAIAKINYLLKNNPKIGYKLVDADIHITNGYDHNVSNDKAVVNPGRFVKVGIMEKLKPRPNRELLSVKRRLGKGKVHLLQYETGDWQLMVEGKPFVIKGITYAPSRVGQSPDTNTLGNWMEEDFNANGRVDGPYDAFVDKNFNNQQDKDEPSVGDFKLMQEMGVNTLRLYHHPQKIDKVILRDMYEKYGIRVIVGDFLGKYAIGSGAPWNPGTDYTNEEHKKNMLASVMEMVNEFKDEPYILMWLLGNENVYGYACNADKNPQAFFSFANEVAKKIKEADPEHPVAICNGDAISLDVFGTLAPDIDVFGTNAYRGNFGFGSLWKQVKKEADRPAFITEYGCPAHAAGKSAEQAQELQAEYHKGSWEDIAGNMAFVEGGQGNALGGVVFEWLDEWWKAYEPSVHDTKPLWPGPFPDGYMHEEWLGLCSQGDGTKSPFLRQLRKAYYTYKKLWK